MIDNNEPVKQGAWSLKESCLLESIVREIGLEGLSSVSTVVDLFDYSVHVFDDNYVCRKAEQSIKGKIAFRECKLQLYLNMVAKELENAIKHFQNE